MNNKFYFIIFFILFIFIFIYNNFLKKNICSLTFRNDYIGYYLRNKNEIINKINLNEIDERQFFEKYVIKRKPVIFNNTIKGKFNNWNNSYLKKIIGEDYVNVLLVDKEYVKDKFQKLKFNDFINNIENGNNKYYLNVQLYNKNNERYIIPNLLKKLYKLNEFPIIPSILGNIIPYQINIWIGNNNTKSKLHHDYHDNLYIVIKGKKIFKLYSPKDAENLYTNGCIYKINKNGLIQYDKKLIKKKVHYSKIDIDQKKSKIFKKYNKYINAKETICEINEGEMLYMPCGWFHQVTSFNNEKTNENHIAISYWCHSPDLLNKHSFFYPYKDKNLKYHFDNKLKKINNF